jgi:polysaccharide biosynthesis transport protein
MRIGRRSKDEFDMDPNATRESLLHEYLAVVRRNRWLVLAAVLAVPLVAFAVSLTQPVRYQATSRVLVNVQNLSTTPGSTAPPVAPADTPERIADTQAELARVSRVIQQVLRTPAASGLRMREFLNSSAVSADPNTDILSFTVAAGTRPVAEVLATTYAQAFRDYRRALDTAPLRQARAEVQERLAALQGEGRRSSSLYKSLQAKDEQLQSIEALQTSNATVVQPAETATRTQPKTARNVLLGAGLGLLVGIALAFLREAVDARVVTAAEVRNVLRLPLLGRLWEPPRNVRKRRLLATLADPGGSLAQAFRLLRSTIDSLMPPHGEPSSRAQSIAVTSATTGEGRSTTVANLGIAFARTGRRVALVNADLRQSSDDRGMSLDQLFGLDLRLGLADVIAGGATMESALVFADVSPAAAPVGLWVLPAGSVPADLADPATVVRLDEVLGDLAERVDVVLVDCPPVLLSADSVELVTRADAAVVVVRANRISRPTLAELSRLLESSPAYVMGFVLTGADEGHRGHSWRKVVPTSLPRSLTALQSPAETGQRR